MDNKKAAVSLRQCSISGGRQKPYFDIYLEAIPYHEEREKPGHQTFDNH